MYIPPPYRETRQPVLLAAIAARSFGTLTSVGPEGIQLSHIPFVVRGDGDHVELVAHLARSNPHWRSLKDNADAVISFLVDDAYISPGWYPSKQESGRVVPTWNYVIVEARGTVQCLEAASDVRTIVDDLSRRHEEERLLPWSVDDAPVDYLDTLLRGIVGIRMRPQTIVGAWKLDQSKREGDRQGAARGLREVEGKSSLSDRMLA